MKERMHSMESAGCTLTYERTGLTSLGAIGLAMLCVFGWRRFCVNPWTRQFETLISLTSPQYRIALDGCLCANKQILLHCHLIAHQPVCYFHTQLPLFDGYNIIFRSAVHRVQGSSSGRGRVCQLWIVLGVELSFPRPIGGCCACCYCDLRKFRSKLCSFEAK